MRHFNMATLQEQRCNEEVYGVIHSLTERNMLASRNSLPAGGSVQHIQPLKINTQVFPVRLS
jgi:hypothetical protein